MTSTTLSQQPDSAAPPWWKFGYVWLILAGPIIVIFAGFYTLWLAIKTPDPVISADYYRQGIEINKTLVDKNLLPALSGRNHTATPPADQPAPR